MLAAGCGKLKVVEADKLLERGGLFYEINSEKPFTGRAVEYWSSEQKKWEAEYRAGKLHGVFIQWHENGQREMESEWRNGELIEGQCWDAEGSPKECEQVYEDIRQQAR